MSPLSPIGCLIMSSDENIALCTESGVVLNHMVLNIAISSDDMEDYIEADHHIYHMHIS